MRFKLPLRILAYSVAVWLSSSLASHCAWGQQPGPSPDFPAEPHCPDAQQLRQWFTSIQSLTVDIRQTPSDQPLPIDCAGDLIGPSALEDSAPMRTTLAKSLFWTPTEFFHQPLYFDDVRLEDYGQTFSPTWQPLLSTAHFFSTVPVIPYKMGLAGPFQPVAAVRIARPGSPAPPVQARLPWDWRAATLEAGTWLGFIFLLP